MYFHLVKVSPVGLTSVVQQQQLLTEEVCACRWRRHLLVGVEETQRLLVADIIMWHVVISLYSTVTLNTSSWFHFSIFQIWFLNKSRLNLFFHLNTQMNAEDPSITCCHMSAAGPVERPTAAAACRSQTGRHANHRPQFLAAYFTAARTSLQGSMCNICSAS